MTALVARKPPYGRRAWTIDNSAAVDLAAAAANATTEEIFGMVGVVVGQFTIPYWARRAASPAGVFFSHARPTTDGNFAVATANSTGAPVNPAPESIDLGPVFGGTHKVSESGPLTLATGAFAQLVAGSGTIAAGNINANISVARPLTPAATGSAGDAIVMSPRTALAAGFALDQGVVVAGGAGLASLHNLTGGALDPGAQRFDWVRLRRTLGGAGNLANVRPTVSASGAPLIRRFRVTIDHGAIAAAATLEATAALAARVPILVPDETLNRISVAYAVPTAALPAGFAVSHARISAVNTVSVGLSNVSGAGPTDPAAVTYDIYVFTPPSR